MKIRFWIATLVAFVPMVGLAGGSVVANADTATSPQLDTAGAHASEPGATVDVAAVDAAASIKTKLDRMQSLSGRFEQTLFDKSGIVVQESAGEFHLLRPDYFLWQSEAPYEQTVLGTPDKVWVHDPDLEQVTIQARTPEQQNNPASILAGDADEIRSTFAVNQSEAKGMTTYTLKPLTNQSSYDAIEFVFAGDSLQRLSFRDQLGQTTHIKFSQLTVNPKLEKDFFTFVPPEGTDIIVNE